MSSEHSRVLMGLYFYPRGGSAHAAWAIAAELAHNAIEVTLLAGSRSDIPGGIGLAERFFSGAEIRAVDFTPALGSSNPTGFDGGPGTAPMHASYEDRPGAEDPVFATLDEAAFALQVESWARELEGAGAADADVLYLHHLTPMNEATSLAAPGVPVIGHIHGSELLMLERIAAGAPESWEHAAAWEERIREWAAACERIVVNSPSGLARSMDLLDLPAEHFALVPNGFKPDFAPRRIDRAAHWRRHFPGEPGLAALDGTVLLSVGRFTEVKRLPLLIEAFAEAHPRFEELTALVLLGGYPGEWEGEHPLDAIERTGARDVFLAGWHDHADLPDFLNSSDVLVHPSVMEQFGQVIVEAMACGLPCIAVDRGGPSDIIEDGRTGWLIEPDDRSALVEAMVGAVNDPAARSAGGPARAEAAEHYAWEKIGARIAALVHEAADEAAGEPAGPLLPA